eukprot:m.172935 g.172935  ORF g.172935 m.172935 type:complete len:147 (-) comp13500_c1_seq98:1912-2352(-)
MCAYVLTPFFIQPRFSPFPLCVQHTSLYCQQTALSFVLCVLVMRLKMLANPLLCVCASLLVSQSFRSQFVQHRHVILRVFVVFAVVSSTCGVCMCANVFACVCVYFRWVSSLLNVYQTCWFSSLRSGTVCHDNFPSASFPQKRRVQ